MRNLILTAALGMPTMTGPVAVVPQSEIDPGPLGWAECGISLGVRAGLARHDAERTVELMGQYSYVRDGDFLRHLMAVAYVESRMRWDRRSGAGAVGILQVTLEAARSVRGSGLPVLVSSPAFSGNRLTLSRLAQPELNVNTGSSYLWLALNESSGDWIQALARYNGGYVQQLRVLQNKTLTNETAQYIIQVQHLAHTCGL